MNPELWARIKPIFYEAAEQPASGRAAFIRSRCGDDESLAVEIESLLDAHDHAGAFIEGVPDDSARLSLEVEPTDAIVGRRIGPYQVIREIASGGMGAVYLAERADGEYQKQVAIKLVRRGLIRRGMDTDFIVRRFRHERQILADLDHPNIARLLVGGATETGLPYFVMEYIDGMPIDLHCDTNGLPTRERLKLFRTVCSAVHYAHQRSIVHRDIKPRNILVTADGNPRLLDFGIAKLFDPELSSQAPGSTTTSLMMTPEYASPEQIRGEPVTPASDLYSLGVLLYELLTGHRPYRLRNRQPHEIARVICEEEPQKPSTAVSRTEEVPGTDGKSVITLTPESVSRTRDGEAGQLRRLLSGDVDSIVLMAMRKQPEQRYASVDELSSDIGRHLDGLPVVARKQMRRRLRGNLPAHWKAAAVLTLFLTVLLVGTRLLIRSPDSDAQTGLPGIRTVAVLPLRSLDPNEDQSLGLKLTDALIQRLGRLRQVVVRPTGSVQGYERRNLDPLEAGREQQVDAVLDGSFQRSGQRLHVRVQLLRVSDGRQLWEQAFDQGSNDPFYLQDVLAEQTAQALLPQLAGEQRKLVARRDTENVEANRLYSEGRYYWNKRNVEGLQKSVDLLEHALALDRGYARAYSALADSYITLSDYALLPAVEAFPKARDAATKALALDDSLGEAYTALAMIRASYEWDWAGADEAFRQAIERNPHYATAHQWYAEFLTGMGRHPEALEQIHLAQQLDPLSLIIKSIEALNLNYARDYDSAIAQCLRVTSLDPSFGEVYAYLGFAYEQKKMFREAMDAYQKYSTLMGYNTPAKAAIRSSPVLDARDYWKKMFELSKPPAGSKLGAAQALAQLGETDQAIAFLEQACAGHSYGVLYLKVHPSLDPLRPDPRFQELMRRVAFAN
jgi:serine/threonine protein kinase/tetratricopeptide (TPR) repeat protein